MRTRGYIDGVFGSAVRGWVVDLDNPSRPMHVVARFDGIAHPAVAADEPRADLAKAGIGAGIGGFRVHLGLPPGEGSHAVAVQIEGTAIAVPLASDFRITDKEGEPRPDVDLYEEQLSEPIAAPVVAAEPGHELDAEDVAEPPPAAVEPRAALLVGEHGWLFACPARGFDLLRGVARPARDVVDGLLRRVGEPRLVAVVPDKLFVYPEHSAARMPVQPNGRLAEHFAARAQDDDRLRVLDLLPVLLRARVHGRIFSRTGLAPTPLGAFHAYRAVAKTLGLVPCPVDAVRLGADLPVDPPPLTTAFVWQGEGLRVYGQPLPSAGAVEAALTGFAVPETSARSPLTIVCDAGARAAAELLAAHGATVLDVADADQAAGDVVWLLSDAGLVALASG